MAAVPVRSDYSRLAKFPEVYYGQVTSKAPFFGGERAVTGRGSTQHIASLSADKTATSCVDGPRRAGGVRGDPELPFFGSS